MFIKFIIFICSLLCFTSAFSQAVSGWVCDSVFKSSNYGCDQAALANSAGGSYPLSFDAFNVNPSALPVFPTPLGVEMFTDNSKLNFAMIKGTEGAGMGLSSSNTNGTFFSNISNVDIAQTVAAREGSTTITESEQHYAPNLNAGASLATIKYKSFSSTIGGSVKYNKQTQDFRPGLGTTVSFSNFNGSFALFKDSQNNNVITVTSGIKIAGFLADYSLFRQTEPFLVETYVVSLTYATGKLTVTYAFRKQTNAMATNENKAEWQASGVEYKERHSLLGISYRFSNKLMLGFYSNYVLGKGSSFVLQYLF